MMNDEIFDKVFCLHDKAEFNNFLEAYKAKIIEETLCLLPQIMISLSVKTKGLEKLYGDFFQAHPELEAKKDQVANVVMALELEDGSRNLEEILSKVPAKIAEIENLQGIKPIDIDKAREAGNGCI